MSLLNNPLFTFALGIVGTIITTLLTGFSKEYFKERDRRIKHRIDVARGVHKLCAEGRASSFRKEPQDYINAQSVLNDLESVDRDMSYELAGLLMDWELIAAKELGDKSKQGLYKSIGIKERVLNRWTGKIRAGKGWRWFFKT